MASEAITLSKFTWYNIPNNSLMEALMISKTNNMILKMGKRAERQDPNNLVSTFVDVGPLFTLLSSNEHQILYGRRGTGKTHALSYLANTIRSNGDVSIEIDMNTLGSTGGIYSDPQLPISERATRLLVDTLAGIHERLRIYVFDNNNDIDFSILGPLLDGLSEAITEVIVQGDVQKEEVVGEKQQLKESIQDTLSVDKSSIQIKSQFESTNSHEHNKEYRYKSSGSERHRVHFGKVLSILSKIMEQLSPKKCWILLDEWSEIPLDIQPYLADLLRKTLFPLKNVIVKIAAIEQRSNFRISTEHSGYIGITIGSDIEVNLNLDEYMVFDNSSERAKEFFNKLFFRHMKSISEESFSSEENFIQIVFTQLNGFDELVKAAEGVPRDAINIFSLAAQRAGMNKISIPDIRGATKTWYTTAKEKVISTRPMANQLLRWIVEEVIKHRRARAFLLRSDIHDALIDFLFDERVLHILRESVSGQDQPGVRYKVYSIDYGCYVDLVTTTKAPQGLFEVDSGNGVEFIDVPATDYRSIRRAILDIDKFYASIQEEVQ